MRDVLKLVLVLMLISAIAAGGLALTNQATRGRIVQQQLEAKVEALSAVLPGDSIDFVDISQQVESHMQQYSDIEEVWLGQGTNQVEGIIILVAPMGYSGRIQTIVAISSEGRILGVQVLTQSETPSLGSKVAEKQWLEQFKGQSSENPIQVVKASPAAGQVQAITAATVSSEAMVAGVNQSIGLFNDISKEVLK